jgi:hypothetical protein
MQFCTSFISYPADYKLCRISLFAPIPHEWLQGCDVSYNYPVKSDMTCEKFSLMVGLITYHLYTPTKNPCAINLFTNFLTASP